VKKAWAICAGLTVLAVSAGAAPPTITPWINAQGPNQSTAWTDPSVGNFMSYDAFGKLDATFGLNLGTTVSGRVTSNTIGDGTDSVSVIVHTRDGLCWGFTPAGQAFGHTPAQVLGGAPPALGHAITSVTFLRTTGAPLPSWNTLVFNPGATYILEKLTTTIQCEGELLAASGFPDGTPGKAHTRQTGLFQTGVPTGCPPEQDENCFPSEKIRYWPAGQ
jgi:hypothetical protein